MGCVHSARRALSVVGPDPGPVYSPGPRKAASPQKIQSPRPAKRAATGLPEFPQTSRSASSRSSSTRGSKHSGEHRLAPLSKPLLSRPVALPGPGTLCRRIACSYSELVNAIIRPPRTCYRVSDLGPTSFSWSKCRFMRLDFRLTGARGQQLSCSWWRPSTSTSCGSPLPCVIYMHGNSSCRLEAVDTLKPVLGQGLSLLAFDFAGCGHSDGDVITLGYLEKEDLAAVVTYLRANDVSSIALWGRSMGAATALLYGSRDPGIKAMVLDSPFASLQQLVREVVDRAPVRFKPNVAVNAVLRLVRATILRKTGMDIMRLRPAENVSDCAMPAVFLVGSEDTFIPPHHTEAIFKQYAGEKRLITVDGGHNSMRPTFAMEAAVAVLKRAMNPEPPPPPQDLKTQHQQQHQQEQQQQECQGSPQLPEQHMSLQNSPGSIEAERLLPQNCHNPASPGCRRAPQLARFCCPSRCWGRPACKYCCGHSQRRD